MSDPLLLEIGCEEIPARMIAAGAEDLRARVATILDAAGFPHGPSHAWGGTRRLAVRVESVAGTLPGKDELVLGPPASVAFRDDGQPTPAGAGFAKKQGGDPSTLQKIETEKGVYAGFRRAVGERTLQQVLATALPASIAGMSFPKTMRWGTGAHRFVRPVQWVVALHGAAVLDLEVMGATSGRASEGHRFLAPGPVVIADADRYVDALRAARVLVEPEARRDAMLRALRSAAEPLGGEVVKDDELLGEVVDLVEWPGVVAGRFDAAFLDLPPEILVTTLKHHQKSFSVRGNAGLLPAFLSVANTDRDPAGHVRRGNEWVVVGRLEDARFFWDEDRKRTLASRVDDLKRVTFHKKLGSYEDKTKRVTALAAAIAERLGPTVCGSAVASEAARLAKADLVTGLVGEFPELQGLMGRYYAEHDGETPSVAAAIEQHYWPRFAGDALPAGPVAQAVALADKLETLAGMFGIGAQPTGDKDPFGLRRHAIGVIRILMEKALPVTLGELVAAAFRTFAGVPAVQDARTELASFVYERLRVHLRDAGYSANQVEAVLCQRPARIDLVPAQAAAVKAFGDLAEAGALASANKRIVNILRKAEAEAAVAVDRGRLADGAEHDLYLAFQKLEPVVDDRCAAGDFAGALLALATAKPAVDRFFDEVLVMADDPAIRANRLALLRGVARTMNRVADISKLAA